MVDMFNFNFNLANATRKHRRSVSEQACVLGHRLRSQYRMPHK